MRECLSKGYRAWRYRYYWIHPQLTSLGKLFSAGAQNCALKLCSSIDNHDSSQVRKRKGTLRTKMLRAWRSTDNQRQIWSPTQRTVLPTIEPRGLVQVDALPNPDFMCAWKAATDITNMFLKRPLLFFNINVGNRRERLPNRSLCCNSKSTIACICHNKFQTHFYYPLNQPVTEKINFVHYKSILNILQQAQEHS